MLAYTLVSLNVWYHTYWFRNSLETKLHPKIYIQKVRHMANNVLTMHFEYQIFIKKIYTEIQSDNIILFEIRLHWHKVYSLIRFAHSTYRCCIVSLCVWESVSACNLVEYTLQKCYTSAWKFPHFASAQNVMSILYKCLTKLSFSRWYAVEHFHNKIPNNACISHTFEF